MEVFIFLHLHLKQAPEVSLTLQLYDERFHAFLKS